MNDSAALTRSLLGGTSDPKSETDTDEEGGSYFGCLEGYRPSIAIGREFSVSEYRPVEDLDSEQEENSGSGD